VWGETVKFVASRANKSGMSFFLCFLYRHTPQRPKKNQSKINQLL
jgi:hypothetical protein